MHTTFKEALMATRDLKNSLYAILKHSFLYHSNKIEGSTFTAEALALLLDKNVVTGKQMLENDLPLKIVSWDSEDLYRSSLNLCDLEDYTPLVSYIQSLEDFKEVYRLYW